MSQLGAQVAPMPIRILATPHDFRNRLVHPLARAAAAAYGTAAAARADLPAVIASLDRQVTDLTNGLAWAQRLETRAARDELARHLPDGEVIDG
jgi:hypothetical protein